MDKYIRTVDGIFSTKNLKHHKADTGLEYYKDSYENVYIPIKPANSFIENLCDYILYKNEEGIYCLFCLYNLFGKKDIAEGLASRGCSDISYCTLEEKGVIKRAIYDPKDHSIVLISN